MPNGMPFRLTDYLELLGRAGKITRTDKRGAIPRDLPPLMARLQIAPNHWLYCSTQFHNNLDSNNLDSNNLDSHISK